MSSKLESDVCYRVYGGRHLVKAKKGNVMAAYRRIVDLMSRAG